MTCDTSAVPPPNTAVWYDLDEVVADVLAILRLTDADVDTARIQTLIPAVAVRFDQFWDRVDAIAGPPPSPDVHQAHVRAVVEEYRGKDPNVAVIDALATVRAALFPHKKRFGVS